ncbi:lipopolysaccharide biosynthesis protein, partial [Salmonella enterica subsp. enterica serovar Javiana]|nr:lipopolysaccharide biosynthesis protein [Salmonella enterica]EAP3007927.1 lipopolysaccharide biosynthesis protein [Salmonella enterica subsp. enterica serovar Poona]EAS4954749.1 lipopolysaccharide biosynthesis protein [Salmonella enterica subsp. enterica serovar Ruiru]EBL8519962.1 lipopolysaccharide biosynthesis protein [Salmonella enterica subsp. enterica serovar Worthington]ECR5743633.1 lipopolysaccharide biosynthesis protein [Salmonella enterica subsp. enterica serovar Kentucky]EEE541070
NFEISFVVLRVRKSADQCSTFGLI